MARRRGLALCWVAAALAGVAGTPRAAEYPERPVTVIHNYGPGTASDATARSLAEAFAGHFGKPFPVVNREGAAGVVGARALAASPPDGHTILIGPMTALTSQPHLVRNSGLGPEAVTPVCSVSANMLGIVVRADSPWRDGRDIVAEARRRALHFGSTGRVSLTALGVHRMQAATGGQYVSVPFRSDGASLTELLGGRLDFSAISIANATPQIRDGALRLVGVFADRRYPAFPEVPTFPEQGISAEQMSYAGVVLPLGAPEPVVARLEEACAAAMASAPFRRAVERYGIVVDHRGRAAFARLLADEHRSLGTVLHDLGVQPD